MSVKGAFSDFILLVKPMRLNIFWLAALCCCDTTLITIPIQLCGNLLAYMGAIDPDNQEGRRRRAVEGALLEVGEHGQSKN